jgi:hypothetical protein
VVLTSHSHCLPISHRFLGLDSGSTHLVNSKLTAGVIIETLDEWNVNSFAFRLHEITVEKLDDTTDVLGTLVGCEMDNKLEELFLWVLLECNLLVEDELVIGGW